MAVYGGLFAMDIHDPVDEARAVTRHGFAGQASRGGPTPPIQGAPVDPDAGVGIGRKRPPPDQDSRKNQNTTHHDLPPASLGRPRRGRIRFAPCGRLEGRLAGHLTVTNHGLRFAITKGVRTSAFGGRAAPSRLRFRGTGVRQRVYRLFMVPRRPVAFLDVDQPSALPGQIIRLPPCRKASPAAAIPWRPRAGTDFGNCLAGQYSLNRTARRPAVPANIHCRGHGYAKPQALAPTRCRRPGDGATPSPDRRGARFPGRPRCLVGGPWRQGRRLTLAA